MDVHAVCVDTLSSVPRVHFWFEVPSRWKPHTAVSVPCVRPCSVAEVFSHQLVKTVQSVDWSILSWYSCLSGWVCEAVCVSVGSFVARDTGLCLLSWFSKLRLSWNCFMLLLISSSCLTFWPSACWTCSSTALFTPGPEGEDENTSVPLGATGEISVHVMEGVSLCVCDCEILKSNYYVIISMTVSKWWNLWHLIHLLNVTWMFPTCLSVWTMTSVQLLWHHHHSFTQ